MRVTPLRVRIPPFPPGLPSCSVDHVSGMGMLFGDHHPQKWQQPGSPWWKRHSLQLFLWGLTAAQTVGAAILFYIVWINGWDTAPREWGPWIFLAFFGAEYLISIVADTYGAALQVWATKTFFEADSPMADPNNDPDK